MVATVAISTIQKWKCAFPGCPISHRSFSKTAAARAGNSN
jgi:hypothetical protein